MPRELSVHPSIHPIVWDFLVLCFAFVAAVVKHIIRSAPLHPHRPPTADNIPAYQNLRDADGQREKRGHVGSQLRSLRTPPVQRTRQAPRLFRQKIPDPSWVSAAAPRGHPSEGGGARKYPCPLSHALGQVGKVSIDENVTSDLQHLF